MHLVGNRAYVVVDIAGLEIVDIAEAFVPVLKLSRLAGNPMLQLTGTLGRRYLVEYAPTLRANGSWVPIETVTLETNPQSVSVLNAPSRFYRARLVP